MDTGRYNRSFSLLKYTPAAEANAYNERPAAFVEQPGTLWGALKEDSASKSQDYEAMEARTNATLTLRQFPAVLAEDRLRDHQFGQVWVIDAVRLSYGTNETVLTVHLWEQQEGT